MKARLRPLMAAATIASASAMALASYVGSGFSRIPQSDFLRRPMKSA